MYQAFFWKIIAMKIWKNEKFLLPLQSQINY